MNCFSADSALPDCFCGCSFASSSFSGPVEPLIARVSPGPVLAMPWLMKLTASRRVMSCCCRKNTAWLSRSLNSATSTFAPVTSSRPDDWTCRMARWTTRWKPAVGDGSMLASALSAPSSVSR